MLTGLLAIIGAIIGMGALLVLVAYARNISWRRSRDPLPGNREQIFKFALAALKDGRRVEIDPTFFKEVTEFKVHLLVESLSGRLDRVVSCDWELLAEQGKIEVYLTKAE